MNESIKRAILSLLVGGVFGVVTTGCSNQSPVEPTANAKIAATVAQSRPVILTTSDVNTGTQQNQGDLDILRAIDVAEGYYRDDVVANTIEFTGLIVGFSVENQTIQLMEMQGSFKTWIGHVTESSELVGLEGQAVQLSDFGVCSQAITSGELIDDDEFTINYLRMKNF